MPAETIHARWEDLGPADAPVRAYVADPGSAPPKAAVIVLPAIHGPNPYTRGVAEQLAAAGYRAVLIDIFAPGGPPDLSSPEAIRTAVADVDDTRVLACIGTTVQHLRAQAAVPDLRIGTLGFCIGGTHSLLAAARVRGIDAAVAFYGMLAYAQKTGRKPVAPIDCIAELSAPILYHVGDGDPWVGAQVLEEYAAGLRQHGKAHEIGLYRGAGHAFHEHHRNTYRPVAAHASWASTLVFLDWHLNARRAA
jgi:carboxymethylenebutenolidase